MRLRATDARQARRSNHGQMITEVAAATKRPRPDLALRQASRISNPQPVAPKAKGAPSVEHDRNQNVLLDGDGFANMVVFGIRACPAIMIKLGRVVTDSRDSSGAKPRVRRLPAEYLRP